MRSTPSILNALAAAGLFVACGSSGSSGAAGSSPTAPAASVEFRVMTFNIQHGLNGAGQYDLKYASQTIAAVNPDIVGVQELTRNHPSYNCEDQPARIAQMLSSATGRQWHSVYEQEWFTPDRSCQNSGRGDGPETEGSGFFAPEPLPAPTTTKLWNGRLGLMTTLPKGRNLPIIVTHLASGTNGQSDRLRQLDELIPWAASRASGGPKLLIGDFNSSPDTPEYQRVSAQFHDAWIDAVAAGTARGRMDGITHKSSRIDYIFYTPGSGLELRSIENITTGALIGTEASDHNPLVATFAVK
jgi:endonuclease/exonuclease/phosphatase family metal-dependent hydrolase